MGLESKSNARNPKRARTDAGDDTTHSNQATNLVQCTLSFRGTSLGGSTTALTSETRTTTARARLGEYFTFGEDIVMCKAPNCPKRVLSWSSNSTTYNNLYFHLKQNHKIGDGTSTGLAAAHALRTQSTLSPSSGRVKSLNREEREAFRDAVQEMIVYSEYPFSIVQDRWFHNVLDKLRPGSSECLPSRETVARRVDNDATAQVRSLKTAVTSANAVSITSDMWTDSVYRKYLGASAHIITPEWEIKHFALPLKPTKDKVTSANIQKLLLSAIQGTDIGASDPACITTDRGANMKGAITGTKDRDLAVQALPAPWLACFSHVIQRALSEMMASTRQGEAGVSLAQTEKRVLSFTLALRTAIRNDDLKGL